MTKTLVQEGVMINTVGVGTPEGSPLIDHESNELKKDVHGNAIVTKLNEGELRQLAQETQGIYLRLDDTNEGAAIIKSQIETIEQKAIGDEAFVNYKSFFQWFLAGAFLLLLVEMLTSERKTQLS